MGIHRSYSSSLLLASHQGKSFNRRQWNFLLFLVALMTGYVVLSVSMPELYTSQKAKSAAGVQDPTDKQARDGTFWDSLIVHRRAHPARVQHLHRTKETVHEAEAETARERAAFLKSWQDKVDALQTELKEMHEKVEANEALETDLWQLRQQLKEAHQERDPVPQKEVPLSPPTATTESSPISVQTMERLPSASAWCFGDDRYDRLCRFKNLCYLPKREAFILPKGNMSTLSHIPKDRQGALVDLTSLKDHSAFYFDYNEINPDHPNFQNRQVRYIEKPTFILSRFHPGNIMHTIHDDVLGLYHLMKEFAYNGVVGKDDPFALDHYIQFIDAHGGGEYANIFRYLTENPILYRDSLHADPDVITCYRDAIVGNSKQANWYQYGFSSPQGPIANKTVDGHQVREVADYIMRKAGFNLSDPFHLPPSSAEFNRSKVMAHLQQAEATARPLVPSLQVRDKKEQQHVIGIFSRLRNRKLVNEEAVATALTQEHHLPTVYVRMEELTFLEQIAILRRSRLALGMHGSILIMGIFMPRGAGLIELYPYAVPSKNYTPYRHMSSLPGMDLAYAAWENKHEQNSKSYPENHFMYGGLGHLSQQERDKVMHTPTVPKHVCCTNPYWLYRIFQDTIGHVQEIVQLSTRVLGQRERASERSLTTSEVEPSAVESSSVACHFLGQNQLKLTWDAPWNGGRPQGYSIWDHNSFREYLTTETTLTLQIDPTKVTQVWIRPKKDEWRGKYTSRIKCIPPGVLDNVQ